MTVVGGLKTFNIKVNTMIRVYWSSRIAFVGQYTLGCAALVRG